MKIKLQLLACSTLLLCASVARAEFIAAEKSTIATMGQEYKDILNTVRLECGVDVSLQGECIWATSAAWELLQSIGWLLHLNANPNESAGAALLAGPRANVVAAAWSDLDRAIFELGLAPSISVASSLNTLSDPVAVDRTLAYASPTHAIHPRQFGPHGDYFPAQNNLWDALNYPTDAMENVLLSQQAGLGTSTTLALAQLRIALARTIDIILLSADVQQSIGGFAGWTNNFTESLPEDHTRRAFVEFALMGQGSSQFASVARSLHLANVEITKLQDHAVTITDATTRTAAHVKLTRAAVRLSDGWRHLDSWNNNFVQIWYIPGTDPAIPVPVGFVQPPPPPPPTCPTCTIPPGFFQAERGTLQDLIDALFAYEGQPLP